MRILSHILSLVVFIAGCGMAFAKSSSSLMLTSSFNPSTYAASVTFTAIVTPGNASGIVTFKDGNTTLGTSNINLGECSFSISSLTTGTHSITASYGGNANFSPSASAALSQTVNPTNVTAALSASSFSSFYGSTVTFTASLSPSAATGSVTFLDGSANLGTSIVSAGKATLSIATLAVGTHSITASYGGSANYSSSSSNALTHVVNKANSTVALTSSANPSSYGSSVSFTATVKPAIATGIVTFKDGSTTLGTGTISGGQVVYSVVSLTAASHSISAFYGGDGNDNSATSTALNEKISKASPTIVVSSSANPSTYGSAVSFAVAVTPSTATGTVTFKDGNTTLGAVAISNGAATYSTSTLVVGFHSITGAYSGDANDNSGTSAALVEVVNKVSSTIAVASATNPSTYGSSVTFTATVTPATATGTIVLADGSTALLTAPLNNGLLTYSTSMLAVGSHSITASYSGDTIDASSASTALAQVVNKVSPTIALTAAPNPSASNSMVTFTVVVAPATATGTVNFSDGATLLATTAIASGATTYSTSTLSGGMHSITASYSGDATDNGSSSTLTQTVNAATLVSLAIVPTDPTLAAGSGQQLTANGTYSNSSVQDLTDSVTWSSSDVTVATVGTSPGSSGFTTGVSSGTASITAAMGGAQTSVLITVSAAGPALAYSARTDNCVDGRQSGCVSGKRTGQAGSPLLVREKASDPIPTGFTGSVITAGTCPSGSIPLTYPAYCPAPMNSTAIDPDFGSYLVMGTDDTTNAPNSTLPYRASWNMRSDGEWDAFSWDESLLLTENSWGGPVILNVNPAAIHAQTCATAPGCVNLSGIYSAVTGPGDSTHLAAGGNWSFSRVPSESHVLYERAGIATQVNKLVVSSSIASPGTGTLTRSLYVDFTSDTPVPCSVMESAAQGNPTSYKASWAGSFQVADDGSISYAMTGGYDWAESWAVTPIDTFILPTAGNPGQFGFQATAIAGSGTTGNSAPLWCQTTGCTVTDTSSSGSVTWTNIDKLAAQGPGFDVVIYRPTGTAAGCTRLNSRLSKIYRGTANTAPAGYMTTNDQVACTRAGSYPAPCLMPDRFTLHEAEQTANGQYMEFSPTGGEAPNKPGNWNSGTLSCQASTSSWQGPYSSAQTYSAHNVVSYSGLYYTAPKVVPAGSGNAPSGTTSSNTYWSNTESYCSTYLFDTTSTLVSPVTDWAWGSGHAALGFQHKYWGSLYRSMLYGVTCPDCAVNNGRLNPGTPMLAAPLPCDDHGTYRNSGTSDLTPIFSATSDVPAWSTRYVAACYDELCAFDPGGSGLTYRFGHTYNTGSSSSFQIQNNIGVNSPLGDLIAFGSDMMGSRGSNATANAACNNLRGQYRPAVNGTVTYLDYIYPTSNNTEDNIFQATDCGIDNPGATCTQGTTLPNWNSCSTTCTDGGVTWTNVGPNNCRGDIVIMDVNQAHAAP